jgi:catechol-2,3-dioxygenase
VIAFGATGEEFLNWKAHLEDHGLKLRVTDHKLAYSLYFSDPWHNSHEITTYERDYVAAKLAT